MVGGSGQGAEGFEIAMQKAQELMVKELITTIGSCEQILDDVKSVDLGPPTQGPMRTTSMSETVRLDAHRLKGEHYELLEVPLSSLLE